MKLIDTNFDPILNANIELYSVKFSDLKTEAKNWYKNLNLKNFDQRFLNNLGKDNSKFIQMKKAGILSNFFFAYRENDKQFLLDGFNRLFTEYGNIDENPTVYLKIITDKLEDNQLMSIMFKLNLWKLSSHKGEYNIKDFFDRGMRLFLYTKFGIEFYFYDRDIKDWYDNIIRNEEDITIMDYYFRNEMDYAGYFKFGYGSLENIFSNVHIIDDFKEIIKSNDYPKNGEPFKNYKHFLYGFAMFLAWRRALKDEREYKLKIYIEKLKENKKFFKKIQGMSGTDSTRINIFKFFREIYKKNN